MSDDTPTIHGTFEPDLSALRGLRHRLNEAASLREPLTIRVADVFVYAIALNRLCDHVECVLPNRPNEEQNPNPQAPTASEASDAEDVEALADAYAERQIGYRTTNPRAFRNNIAKAFLASADAVRRKAGADALTEAADNWAHVLGAKEADLLREIAARIARESR